MFRWLTYCWYFEIQSISMVDVLLILWDTKCFDGWRTINTLRYEVFLPSSYCLYCPYLIFARVDTALCSVFLDSILTKLYTERTKQRPRIVVPLSPLILPSFLSFGNIISFLSWILLLSVSFDWHAGARSPSYAVQILMSFLFPFFLYYVRFDGVTLWVMR